MTEAARKQTRGGLAQVHAALGLSEGQGPQAGASSREVRL